VAKIRRLVWTQHVVGKGETSVARLAQMYNTTPMSLQTTNNDELLILNPGRKLIVHNKDGKLYEVRKATETLDQIVARYHRDRQQALMFKEKIIEANDLPGSALLTDYEFSKGQRVLLPKVSETWDTYRFPFSGWGWGRISSRFGARYHPLLKRTKFHEGLDIAKPWGTPVYPARSGKVVEAGWTEGYGQLLVIRHSDGATTRYGHLSKIYVKVGDIVQRGKTLIGRVGSTGLSTGPHLHFEVRDRSGRAVNPGSKIGRR
jgi:murein DD-endopeptidase MepM/ murein hydrolase activator NlpD